ncbi:uncharacterized protein LOC115622317 [Scaptodrosophila lebanonensis]|uniref:Uncharacterized protein LOC115622317 n=1 Tax=Drosophila lebanonensis TaxID=7225 RepID=A0A6J2TAE7_DROLE|nr:uncharacterized protein LOC115622317 [Scaptodrosophila lebanonensis]
MPVIADATTNDEPPAKCCKYCEESTLSVDGGPPSWRLTLDQDLIDTLKGNFPSWFQSTSAASATAGATVGSVAENSAGNSKQQQQQQLVASGNIKNNIIPISIDTKTSHHNINNNNSSSNSNNNTLQKQQQQHHTTILNSSSSASPASSISSNCSKKSSSSSSSSSSSVSSCSSSSSTCSSTSACQATASRFVNKSTSTSQNKSLVRSLKATHKTTHNNICNNTSNKVGQLVKSASLHSLSSGSSGSGSGASSLLATISTSPITTVELISSAACNGLLATRLSGKSIEHTFQDIILLHEAYDDMSEGEQRLHATFLGSSDDGNNSDFYDARQSPPKAIVDSSPLQPAMDKNKESLKVKLMVRRPHSQLVEQGIIPSLKTSPAIHEQCKQLERAKTSDLLKAKIQQRPNREDLERLHILEEDECHIDPSLAEKQRMLKKARLADQLNSQIQHRPGPLELIKKNILHTEKPIEKIVKEGLVSFKATSEGLLTRPQHPNSYVTFDEDSQSSESDTRQTPPRVEQLLPTSMGSAATPDMLQTAANSAGIVTMAVNMPTNGGQLVVTSPPSSQLLKPATTFSTPVPPPPPPPPPMPTQLPTNAGQLGIKVKQETANLFEELCQSVAGHTASPSGGFLPMLPSPCSLGSTTSTLSPLSSIASPPQSINTRLYSPALQLQPISVKSDAPGKDKNRKKSKTKPVSKARTIKFHEYKGPPSAAGQKQDNTQPEETSYQLMLEQQNCLLKFLENLNKNQSILPSASTGSNLPPTSLAATTTVSTSANSITVTTKTVPAIVSQAGTTVPAPITLPNTISITSSAGGAAPLTFGDASSIVATQPVVSAAPLISISQQHPPALPSPALSVGSSIPPSPATSYAESSSSITDLTRLEKMKVSDLKQHLKRRNLPVSGPKPQLIERLKPYLPLETLECTTVITTPNPPPATEVITIGDAMDTSSCTLSEPQPVAMIVGESPVTSSLMEHEQMDVVQQLDPTQPMRLQTILPPQPQTATIILSNEELLREQQRKIHELQRQLQRSQQELQQIRQREQQNQQQQQQQTVTAQVVNALPSQQITLITTTGNGPSQSLTVLPQLEKTTALIPAKVTLKTTTTPKQNGLVPSANSKKLQNNNHTTNNSNNGNHVNSNPSPMSQKMVVKQHLEAKIQKQKAAAAAAAAAQAQQQQQQALAQQQKQLRLLTQKTQTVLIPTTTSNTSNASKLVETKSTSAGRQSKNSNSNQHQAAATIAPVNGVISSNSNTSNTSTTTTTATILTNPLPLSQVKAPTTTTATMHHNNLGLVWNEGNQTIFLLGLNDQHMTAHTLGNISLTTTTTAPAVVQAAPPASTMPVKKLLNGHQRTNSLPSITFPLDAKPFITTTQPQLQLHQAQGQRFQPLQPGQQFIQLDIKPTSLAAAAAPPPPQYEEATKQLAATKAATSMGMVPLVKIKEEPVPLPAVTNTSAPPPPLKISCTQHASDNKRRPANIKSEQVTDVLDILIKQGELPETVLEPITPLTPLTPGGSNTLMSDLSVNSIFSAAGNVGAMPTTVAGGASIVPLVPKIEPPPTPQSIATLDISMDTTPHASENISYGSATPATNSTTLVQGYAENIDMASPLQPDAHIDAESVAKTLDIFLEQHHPTPPPATPPKCSGDKIAGGASPDAKINHFDEYELLELMSQQLEMDIGDDSNNFCGGASAGGSAKTTTEQRRDLNPLLQTSITELLDGNSSDSGLLNNNHQADVDFDAESFVAQLTQHTLAGGNGSAVGSNNNSNSDGGSNHGGGYHNNNSNAGISSMTTENCGSGGGGCVGNSSSNCGQFSDTPMDVCDDFENTLNSFMQAVTQPQASLGDYASGSVGMTNGGVGSMESSGGAVDAFNSGGDIFDLFNMDDYKMSWAAGDFTV